MPAPGIIQTQPQLRPAFIQSVPSYYNRSAKDVLSIQRMKSTYLTVKYGSLTNADEALGRISDLKADWDSYGAVPPTRNAINGARQVLEALAVKLLLPTTIVPSAEGGVSTYFIYNSRTAYVETYNDGSQALVMYDSANHIDVLEIGTDISLSQVGDKILTFLG